MRIVVAAACAGLAVGLLAGVAASEIIGIAGVLLLHRAVGIRYLPLYLAPIFAVGAVLLATLARRGGRGPRGRRTP